MDGNKLSIMRRRRSGCCSARISVFSISISISIGCKDSSTCTNTQQYGCTYKWCSVVSVLLFFRHAAYVDEISDENAAASTLDMYLLSSQSLSVGLVRFLLLLLLHLLTCHSCCCGVVILRNAVRQTAVDLHRLCIAAAARFLGHRSAI